jgi:hypothetical protein
VTNDDTEMPMGFYQQGRREGNGSRERRNLRHRHRKGAAAYPGRPEFVFRKEAEPANLAAGKTWRISDLDLASRMSFFLWSIIPDDAAAVHYNVPGFRVDAPHFTCAKQEVKLGLDVQILGGVGETT